MADDLSSMSDTELMAIAGIAGPSNDLSSLSDAELMQIAGVDAAPLTGGQKFAGGIANMVPLNIGDEIMAGIRTGVDVLQGKPMGPSYDANLAEVRQYERAFENENPALAGASSLAGNAPLFVAAPSGIAARTSIFGKLGQSAAEGAAWGGAYGLGAGEGIEDRLSQAEDSALWGAAGGAAGSALGQTLAATGNVLGKGGQALGRKALGARQSDYAKSANRLGIITDVPDDEIGTFTKSVLDEFVDSGSLGTSREPAKLIQIASAQEQALEKEVGRLVNAFDGEVGLPVLPEFSNAYKMISEGRIPADKIPSYVKRLRTLEQGIEENGFGSLSYLQRQKVAIGKDWVPEDSVRNEFTRAIYSDLQKTIEKYVPEVQGVNANLRKYKVLMPILQRGLAADESATGFGKFIQAIRTSGGGGVPLLAGAYSGHPVLGALATGTIAATGSPTGMAATGRALQSLSGKAGSVGAGAASASAPAAGYLSSEIRQSDPKPQPQQTRQGQLELESASANSTVEAPAAQFPLRNTSVFEALPNSAEVKPIILKAIETTENSRGKTSPKGAQGTYQLMPAMQKALGVKDPWDDKEAGEGAWKLIKEEADHFDGDWELAFAAYNWGRPSVKKALAKVGGDSWEDIERIAPRETQKYVVKAEDVVRRLIGQDV